MTTLLTYAGTLLSNSNFTALQKSDTQRHTVIALSIMGVHEN